jgi:hypothetical protein
MKLLIFVSIFISLTAFAQTEYLYTNGRGTGFCDGGPQSWFCYDQIKDRAKHDAVQNAYYTCSGKHGHLDNYSSTCNYFCSPFSVPPEQVAQFVQCSSSCTTRCVIEKD